jgi:hypothetical protein
VPRVENALMLSSFIPIGAFALNPRSSVDPDDKEGHKLHQETQYVVSTLHLNKQKK